MPIKFLIKLFSKFQCIGLLPRPDPKIDSTELPMPAFKDSKTWSIKKSTFGQNDYIDILGEGDICPVDLIRGPPWLIGFRGNELQRIQRQLKFVGKDLQVKEKEKYKQLTKRIKYLTWRFNFKFGGIKK